MAPTHPMAGQGFRTAIPKPTTPLTPSPQQGRADTLTAPSPSPPNICHKNNMTLPSLMGSSTSSLCHSGVATQCLHGEDEVTFPLAMMPSPSPYISLLIALSVTFSWQAAQARGRVISQMASGTEVSHCRAQGDSTLRCG